MERELFLKFSLERKGLPSPLNISHHKFTIMHYWVHGVPQNFHTSGPDISKMHEPDKRVSVSKA